MYLDSYFSRIRFEGPRTVTLETLNAVLRHHVETIPFENLSVLLGEPISLEPADLFHKFLKQKRGGYCFEHNTLLLHVLNALGFNVTAMSARVRFQRPERYSLPRTHLCLRVTLDGQELLVDGGFGALSLTAALRLVPDVEQRTPHETRRLVCEGQWEGLKLREPDAAIVHQAYLGGAWHPLYEFTLEHMPAPDREMGNWYTSCHPNSHFRTQLMAARATHEGRISIHNRELTLRFPDGSAQSRLLQTHDELLEALAEHFELTLPPATRLLCPGLAELQ